MENPYPHKEPVVVYSMKEVIDQINRKLDVLPTLVTQVNGLERAYADLDKKYAVLDTDIDNLKAFQHDTTTVSLFKDKVWAKILGIAGAAGAVAGIVASIIAALS